MEELNPSMKKKNANKIDTSDSSDSSEDERKKSSKNAHVLKIFF